MDRIPRLLWISLAVAATAGALGCKGPPPTSAASIAREPNRLLWGDTHLHPVHSKHARHPLSREAGIDTAYRWAQGLPVVHPYTRARVQLERPLDFLVVSERAEALKGEAWSDAIEAAQDHYAPCSFTTFIGWDWSAEQDGQSVHRVVFMDGGPEKARQLVPFGAKQGPRPEELWSWLEEMSARVETDFIAIPHSPNLSGEAMYPTLDSEGQPISAAYAQARMRWERVAEVTQLRGDSETHPALSPDDELADFETLPRAEAGGKTQTEVSDGAYARSALRRGLQLGQAAGANPFQFGMIGSTASQTGLSSADEDYFWGYASSQPNSKSALGGGLEGVEASAQGLTAVWAEENTRSSIFDAFKRREVYATTGPRMRVRFFGGWDFTEKQAQKAGMVVLGYTFGHPMGSELSEAPEGKAPSFLMYALKDPEGANLDRIQMVKGWVDAEGRTHEKVYDVVWSSGRERGPDGKVPPVINAVNLATASYLDVDGAAALHAFWSDPHFDPEQAAFYYLRVLQVPTPRHSLYDAVARGIDPAETGYPPTIQERAYTSPIWYTPKDARQDLE